MAADKRAIDFGKIKRYISNRTAEFYIETLEGEEKESFKSIIKYLDNTRRTKDLTKQYDVLELERIKNKLNNFSSTREQQSIINAINRERKEENTRIKKSRVKRKATPPPPVAVVERTPYEKVSAAFWNLKTIIEEDGKFLGSKEIEVVKKNLIILANNSDVILQERIKFEIQQAYKQAEEIKQQIEKLNTKIKKQ
ncbi:MAG: hypothetical protein LBL58_08200 [Tannerellaceae bacterium]|jgi:hypothetical protein|nr:hypothetical protein [Tannerellaceae bacterium]